MHVKTAYTMIHSILLTTPRSTSVEEPLEKQTFSDYILNRFDLLPALSASFPIYQEADELLAIK